MTFCWKAFHGNKKSIMGNGLVKNYKDCFLIERSSILKPPEETKSGNFGIQTEEIRSAWGMMHYAIYTCPSQEFSLYQVT